MLAIFPYAIARSSLWCNQTIVQQEWFFDNDRSMSNACSRSVLPHLPSCSRTLKQTMDVSHGELLPMTYEDLMLALVKVLIRWFERYFCRWTIMMKNIAECNRPSTSVKMSKYITDSQLDIHVNKKSDKNQETHMKFVWSRLSKATTAICGNVDLGIEFISASRHSKQQVSILLLLFSVSRIKISTRSKIAIEE